jgi:hypothetical protein
MNIGNVSYSQHTNVHSEYNRSTKTDVHYDKQINVNIVHDKLVHEQQRVNQMENVTQHQRIDVYV